MKYLLDTNVIISAILFPAGTPGKAYDLALTTPHTIVIADYTVTELRRVFRVKFPDRKSALERFLHTMTPGITVVPTPATVTGIDIEQVRDRDDWPSSMRRSRLAPTPSSPATRACLKLTCRIRQH